MHLHKKISSAILLILLAMAGVASAQNPTVSIVIGDGQISPQSFQAQEPLTVLVKNAAGQPAANTTVNWTLTGSGGALINGSQTFTDINGIATNLFIGAALFGGNFAQTLVQASALGATANFNVTTAGADPNNLFIPLVQVLSISPVLGDVLTGPAGTTGTAPVRLKVVSASNQGIPNVQVRLVAEDPNGPTISCSGTTGFSDGTGNVNCLPVFGGKVGSGRFTVDVGGKYRLFGPYNFTVTQGTFSTIRITGGNNQSANAGTNLPLQLTARLEDASGGGLAGVPVVWEAVTPGTVTITNASTVSDASGVVTASATLSGTPGTFQIRVRNATGTIQGLFTFQVNVAVTGLSKVAGDSQEGVTNTAFTQPLIVQVNTIQGPIAGVQVQFTANGPISLGNNGVATTDAQGRATIAVQAGATAGPASVTATVGQFSVAYSLTVRLPGPAINSNSFFNGAGGQAGGVSPTAVLTIRGSGLAPGIQGCVEGHSILGPLPQILSNLTVLFVSGGYSSYAPIYSVCNLGLGNEFVNLQVPADIPLGTVTVTVRVGFAETILTGIPVSPVSPGLFETVMSDGKKRAVLQHPDGSYVTLQSPARAGERLRAFATGLGRPVSVSGVRLGSNQGGIPGDDASPQSATVIGVDNQGVNVVSTVYAPYLIGVYVVTFDMPSNVSRGTDINFAVAQTLNEQLVFGNPSRIPVQ